METQSHLDEHNTLLTCSIVLELIWKACNDKLHLGIHPDPQKIIRVTPSLIEEFRLANLAQTLFSFSRGVLEGWFKIFLSKAILDGQMQGITVIKNDEGQTIKNFCTPLTLTGALLMDANCLLVGCRAAKDLGLNFCTFFCQNEDLVHLLYKPWNSWPMEVSSTLKEFFYTAHFFVSRVVLKLSLSSVSDYSNLAM